MDQTAITENLPRAVLLDGASNVRDLGGWQTSSGQRVRFGMLYRGAALSALSRADETRLQALGLRTICDLRGCAERERSPSRVSTSGISVLSLPIEPSVGASLRDIEATREATGEDALTLMRKAYIAYAREWSDQYRTLFDHILRPGSLPLLFHCSAGKDRTGFGAALILTALGVPHETIELDYLATNRLWRSDSELATRLPAPVANVLLRVHPELLDAAFEAILCEHKSIESYFEQRLGLNAVSRRRLRELLLA
jgi:protein-tyrosine phosphatase